MQLLFSKQGDKVNLSGLSEYIKTLKDWNYSIEIKRKQNIRSIPQNNLLHAWLMQLWQSDIGYDPDEWKEVFRSAFLQEERKNPKDKRKKIKRLKSTTELSTIQFNEFLDKIQALAKSQGIKLEYPDNFSYSWEEQFI